MANIQKQNLNFQTEKLKVEALAKIDLLKSFEKFETKFEHRWNGDKTFLELYNSGAYLKDIFKILGKGIYRLLLCRNNFFYIYMVLYNISLINIFSCRFGIPNYRQI